MASARRRKRPTRELERLRADRAAWERRVEEDGQERDGPFVTASSRPVNRLYGPTDLADDDLDYALDLGNPGDYPFTRGIHPTGYRGRPWTIRIFSGFGSAEETNQRFRDLLAHGETGLSIAFDMPTLMGYDHDAEQALGEFGKCGRRRLLAGRYGDPARGHPARPRHHLDDHQRPGVGDLGDVHRRRRATRHRPRPAGRHAPERHPEGVHRPERVHLSAARQHAAGDRHHRVRDRLDAAVEPGQRQRVPHPGGG